MNLIFYSAKSVSKMAYKKYRAPSLRGSMVIKWTRKFLSSPSFSHYSNTQIKSVRNLENLWTCLKPKWSLMSQAISINKNRSWDKDWGAFRRRSVKALRARWPFVRRGCSSRFSTKGLCTLMSCSWARGRQEVLAKLRASLLVKLCSTIRPKHRK
jgi:hypothetical protein